MKDENNAKMAIMCYQVIDFPDERTGKQIKGVKAYLYEGWNKAPATVFVPDANGVNQSVEVDDLVTPVYRLSGKRVKVVDLLDEQGKSIFV